MDPERCQDPWELFEAWLAFAQERALCLPHATTLATADATGKPTARVVLFKGRIDDGLSFYTNYHSRKGRDLTARAEASLVFHWPELGRQVRVEGRCHPLTAEQSDRYFATRPRASQLGAWASAQTQPLSSRQALDDELRQVAERFEGQSVPRPPHWGGYRLMPERFEFWTAHEDRLNERWSYELGTSGWLRLLLAP